MCLCPAFVSLSFNLHECVVFRNSYCVYKLLLCIAVSVLVHALEGK